MKSTIHVYSNRHIKDTVRKVNPGDSIYLENSLSKNRWSLYFKYNSIDESNLNLTYITDKEYWDLELENDMKFDAQVGNQPYETMAVGNKKSKVIWHKFIKKGFDIVKEETGEVSLTNPPQWRNPYGETKMANQILFSKKLTDISCHSYEEGQKTFNAGTAYDSWTAFNTKPDGLTKVRFQEGTVKEVDLTKTNFMPSGLYDEVIPLLATSEEDRVDFIHSRSAYGNDKPHMAKEKDKQHLYPCIYTITKEDVNIWYSNTNENGHFKTPKVIWSNGSGTRMLIDDTGEYGVMNFSYAISDKKENLKYIAQALESEKMKRIMSYNLFTNGIYNNTIIKMFKKDFWREFV